MEYLKSFTTDADYQAFKGGDFITPNVSAIEDTNIVHYNPAPNTIIFYLDGAIKYAYSGMTFEEWTNSKFNPKIEDNGYWEVNVDSISFKTPNGYYEGKIAIGWLPVSSYDEIIEGQDYHVSFIG